jgi:hypothetical protein
MATANKTDDIKFMEKNDSADIGVYVSEYNGREYLHVREHYLVARTGERKPTKKGVALSLEKATELHKLLGEVLVEAGALAKPRAKATKSAAKPATKSAAKPATKAAAKS